MSDPGDSRRFEPSRLRNFGVVAHIDAGKTTLCERMLVRTGVEARLGEVEEGTAVLDWLPAERERGISITAAATSLPWREHQLHLIDTPGHVDFTIEVERSLRVLDGAIVVFDVLAGVQAQSEAVWRQMRRHGCAAVAFLNKLDRPGADFMGALRGMEQRLRVRCAPVAYPYMRDGKLCAVADILRERMLAPGSSSAAQRWVSLPDEIAAEVGVLRAELADALAEDDEDVFQCLARNEVPAAEIMAVALRRRTLDGSLLPVACGSALHQIGIEAALDLVVDYLPSPVDRPAPRAICRADAATSAQVQLLPRADQPLVLFAFKLQRIGRRDVIFVRVVRGRLERGSELFVARSQAAMSVAEVYRPHADHLEPIECALPGDIVAIEARDGFEGVASGDTLCDRAQVCALEPLEVPKPVLALAVEPAHSADREALRAGLARLVREDPSLTLREDEASGQWLLSGMGELHLEIALERLSDETGLELGRTPPRVAYSEVPTRPVRGSARIERPFGAVTLVGAIEIEVLPAPEVESIDLRFDPEASPERGWQPAILASLSALAQIGPRGGYPLARARIVVRDTRRPLDLGSEAGVLQALGSAWHDVLGHLEVELHEPLMAFEVLTPSEYAGGVLGDLQSRGAQMSEVQSEGHSTRVRGSVPLSGMFGYASAVRSLSQGRAGFSMRPQGTRAVPPHEWATRGLTLA